jgi:hypothetical protein
LINYTNNTLPSEQITALCLRDNYISKVYKKHKTTTLGKVIQCDNCFSIILRESRIIKFNREGNSVWLLYITPLISGQINKFYRLTADNETKLNELLEILSEAGVDSLSYYNSFHQWKGTYDENIL